MNTLENQTNEQEEIFSKILRAGRRTYFFDVRATKSNDYYITITESKKTVEPDGSFHFKKHKIYLYKEDFSEFTDLLNSMVDYVVDQKGIEVISDKHQKDFYKNKSNGISSGETSSEIPIKKEEMDLKFEDL